MIKWLSLPLLIGAVAGCSSSADGDKSSASAAPPKVSAPTGFKGATPQGMGPAQPVGGGATDRAGTK